MQNEYRRLWRDGVDFIESRHPPLRELELRPAAHHAHPLSGRCALRLLFQHAKCVGKGRNAIPTQLHIVVQAAADHVQV